MSKLLVQLALLQTKAIVNSYTWATLPLYAAIQRPWRRVKRSKSFGIISKIDPNDSSRIIYSRPSKLKLDHPNLRYNSFTEMMSHLDHKWEIFGVRDIIDEQVQRDPNTGEVIKIDGRDLKRIKLADDYRWYTVGDVLSRAEALARGLRRMGINKCPDKVTLYAENSFEWFCASIALIRMNVTTVTLLPILNDEGVLYGLNQSEASTVIVSQDLLPRLERISPQLNNKLSIIYVPNKLTDTSDTIEKLSKKFPITTFDHVMKIGNENPEMITTEELFPIPDPDDVALIMYTSGTTGNPKGVMLTHKNLVASYKNIIYINEECGSLLINSKYPAFLPMAHLYGYSLNLGHFCVKSKIGLCSPNTMLNSSPSHVPGQIGDFQLLKPEFFGGVPLMLERMLKEIYRQLESRSPLAAPLFTYLMDYKIRWTGRGFQTPIIDRLICKPINQKFGGNLQLLLVGSAPLNDRTQALIKAALNITLVQGYGATEVAPSHVMVQDDLKYGTSGGPFHSVSHYIKDWPEGGYRTTDKPNPRGEIVVGGDTVAAGYYKMPKETEESFITDSDGKRWFETGDIVEILPDLTLKIIDRKKELFKFPNGEFISPGKVESGLRSSIYVENICVCTDSFCNFTIALIAPNHRALKELADKMNKSHLNFEQQCNDAEIVDTVHKSLIELGTSLGYAKIEIPSRIRLVTEEWSQDNNLLTATMKMRRRPVNDFYRDEIKNLFAN